MVYTIQIKWTTGAGVPMCLIPFGAFVRVIDTPRLDYALYLTLCMLLQLCAIMLHIDCMVINTVLASMVRLPDTRMHALWP